MKLIYNFEKKLLILFILFLQPIFILPLNALSKDEAWREHFKKITQTVEWRQVIKPVMKGKINDLEKSIGNKKINKEVLSLALFFAPNKTTAMYLIKKGGDLHTQDAVMGNLLMSAAKEGNSELVRFYMESGLKVNEKTELGRTALYYAAGNIKTDVVTYLLDNGAYIDVQSSRGITPLMVAAKEGTLPIIKTLLERGANPKLVDNGEHCIHYYAVKGKGEYKDDTTIQRMRKLLPAPASSCKYWSSCPFKKNSNKSETEDNPSNPSQIQKNHSESPRIENKNKTIQSSSKLLKNNFTNDNCLAMELIRVSPGSFKMGLEEGEKGMDDAKPLHTVQISYFFLIGKYEVTQAEYKKITDINPSYFTGAQRPVEQVSWIDAVAFCDKLTAKEKQRGVLPAGYVYRLPTEAEWEYAARGGNKSQGYVFSGSNNIDDVGWCWNNAGEKLLDAKGFDKLERDAKTPLVGQKRPNELGLYDMSGNVCEWCYDWYGENYYSESPGLDPAGPPARRRDPFRGFRVYRGGSWLEGASALRVACRSAWNPKSKHSRLGFRIVLAPRITLPQPTIKNKEE